MFYRSSIATQRASRERPHLARDSSKGRPAAWLVAKRGLISMDLSALGSMLGHFTLDDSSLALIALLAGMAGGWTLTNWRDQQLRTKKLKANRKP
jgi:hypothetical protein